MKTFFVTGLLVILVFGTAGAEGDFAGSGASGGEIRLGLSAPEIRTLNPLRAWDPATCEALRLTAGTLTRIDAASGKLVPNLAVSWESDAAGSVWTFRMRPGAKWSDGAALTARDAAFTIQAATDPENAIAAAMALGRGESGARAEAAGAATVRISLARADPDLPWILAELPLIPEHKLADHAARGALATAWGVETKNPAAEVVSCGPYGVKEYRPKERLVLAANPCYWRKDAKGEPLPYLKTVVWILVDGEAALEEKWNKGEIDLVEGIDVARWGAFSARAGAAGENVRAPAEAGDFLLFNAVGGTDPAGRSRVAPERAGWLADARFRLALSKALDRKALAAAVPESACQPAPSLPPWDAEGAPDFPENREEASRLLAEAGFVRTADHWTDKQGKKVALTVLAGTGAVAKPLAAGVARQWKEFGIDVAVENAPNAALWWRAGTSMDFDVALVGISWEPGNTLGRLRPFLDPVRTPLWKGEELARAAWERFDASSDRESRAEAASGIRRAVSAAALLVPLTRRSGCAFAREKLRNVRAGRGARPLTWNLEELSRPAR